MNTDVGLVPGNTGEFVFAEPVINGSSPISGEC